MNLGGYTDDFFALCKDLKVSRAKLVILPLQYIETELSGSLEKLALIPGFTIDILQMIAKGQVKVNSELQISENAQVFIDRMLSRVILALITVAIIIGSSLIAMVDVQPVIFNLPLFTTIGYIAAGFLTISLFRGKYK